MKTSGLIKQVAGLVLMGWAAGACHKPVEPSYSNDRGRQVTDVLV